jgi:glycosyltransferase involved in cell wall biosynthesis
MRTLILAAGKFGPPLADEIKAGREPRLDVFELQTALQADLLDFRDVDAARSPLMQAARKTLSPSAALALLGASVSDKYDAVLTTGEDIGIPYATRMLASSKAPAHTLIAHTLTPWKKRIFFHALGVQKRIQRVLVYATSEENHAVEVLGLPRESVRRIAYHADSKFFSPQPVAPEPDLVCSAGQLLRDYDSLVAAARDQKMRVSIAAGSPWISQTMNPTSALPANVTWGRYSRFELRALYARSAVAVVPILENDYQTGISTILEMMAMGKCLVVTRTRGQTDTIVDGQTGFYVPPGDVTALRTAIQRLLDNPSEAARIGAAARAYIEREATLELFVERIVETVRGSNGPSAKARSTEG